MNKQRLVTTSQAAQLLNLSVQGVHYRINKGQLKSLKQSGKTFVYVDEKDIKHKEIEEIPQKLHTIEEKNSNQNPYIDKLLDEKDNQLKMFKKYIKQMKIQYQAEIKRLESNQQQIVSVFQSEISLLQSAFNEMKNVYTLEHQKSQEEPFIAPVQFIDIKEFFSIMRSYGKTDTQIKAIVLDKVKNKDRRFIYDKISNSIKIYKSEFLDLI